MSGCLGSVCPRCGRHHPSPGAESRLATLEVQTLALAVERTKNVPAFAAIDQPLIRHLRERDTPCGASTAQSGYFLRA